MGGVAKTSSTIAVGNIDAKTGWKIALSDVDCVIHTAARAHILRDSVTSPLEEFRLVNVCGTVRLAKECIKMGVRRFIYISSIGVNGDQTYCSAFGQDSSPDPKSLYAISKLEAEVELKKIFANSNTDLVIVRPPLVYGPNAPGNFGMLLRAIQLGLPLPFGAIVNRRSFIGIDNLCDFILKCIDHPNAANKTLLISDNDDVSTPELVRSIGYALDKKIRLIYVPCWFLKVLFRLLRKEDMNRQIMGDLRIDISSSMDALGWSPLLSLKQGLKKYLNNSLD
jgi:nucleoside-diphosphate-sugar epimerase